MDDNSIILACLAMVVIGGLPFLYMFDDKADHSEGGFKRYIWKMIKECFRDIFINGWGAKPSEEKSSSNDSEKQDSSPKEEQPA